MATTAGNAARNEPLGGVVGDRLKHETVADEIAEAIRSGELKDGSRLAGENELAQVFSVSRGTIRRALSELAQRDLIDTRTGSGSFVTFDGANLDDADGWAKALLSAGARVTTENLRIEAIVDPELAATLGTSGIHFIAVDRLRRLIDGPVVSIERSIVPAVGELADIPVNGLIDGSLTRTLQNAGLRVASGEQWVQVAPLNSTDAALFGRPAGTPYLHSTNVNRDSRGAFVEKLVSVLDPVRFRFHLKF